jgi:predicted dehydrogenase
LGVVGLTDLAVALADPTIDAIGLFTGPKGRAVLIERCLRAGKHVMTTKPFEQDAAAAERVLSLAAELGLTLHANSPSPGAADLTVIRQWMTTHDIGRPVAARAEIWNNYDEKADGSWYDDPVACPVPPIYRLGIYLINDLITVMGRPAAVQVQSSRLLTGRPTADHAQLCIRFADGGLAHILASLCIGDGDAYRNGLALHCERGSIYRNWGPERGAEPCSLKLVRRQNGERTIADSCTLDSVSGDYEWATFAQAVRGKGQPRLDPVTVCGAIRVINAMAEADRTRQEVVLA